MELYNNEIIFYFFWEVKNYGDDVCLPRKDRARTLIYYEQKCAEYLRKSQQQDVDCADLLLERTSYFETGNRFTITNFGKN